MALTDSILAYWNLNDDGSGGVSLVDSTGNGYTLTNNNDVTLGTGIIAGCAVLNGSDYLSSLNIPITSSTFSYSGWIYPTNLTYDRIIFSGDSVGDLMIGIVTGGGTTPPYLGVGRNAIAWDYLSNAQIVVNQWQYVSVTDDGTSVSLYINGNYVGGGASSSYAITSTASLGYQYNSAFNVNFFGSIDETGIWSRALSPTEITSLYNNGTGFTYPFNPALQNLYYNNAQADGDWGNLANWWQDSGFTFQATALPTATNPVNLYGAVTQNTQGADQCFCASASFWSADFGAGLTLQATGVVNMQGSSIMAGTTTDGVSMHDSSQLSVTSVVDGNVVMRDSSRAFGSILGNATIYYDGGNGQFPIGGTVAGSVTYLGWPAVSPQWFNDKATGGANDGDFNNQANWWTDNTYATRPINSVGTQALPDASTDVFIAPNTGIVANTGTANPTINSVTANNSNIQNISITATNGFLFSGNQGAENATLYGTVTFQDTAYNFNTVIQGNAIYKSSASLQNSWNENSLGNLNQGSSYGSTGFVVNISGGGGGGFISRLLNFPWFIKF